MQPKLFKRAIVAAVAAALVQMAHAEDAKDVQATSTDATNNSGLNLEQVVVTASATGGSKMKQSLSISTLEVDQILQAQPANTSDILRSVPGVHAESSGGGGNANVTVRGLPISAGGSRYVQFQENGLPVLLFGDIAFATPDMFIRADTGIDHLEVVRGGSASTLATNSPGGVINFITKTGEEKGGSVGFTTGVGFDENRIDFNYGSPITDKTRAFVSGYYNPSSEGPRNATSSSIQGGQIRGNVTHDLDNGFVRLNFKHLDDQQPLYMPAPVSITNGTISAMPGIDPRKASFYSPYWVADVTPNKQNGLTTSDVNSGLTTKSNVIGFEADYKLDIGLKVNDKFQHASNSGRFISIFPADNVSAAPGSSFYATGPNKGQAYTGNVFTATVFNTSLDSLDNTTNDLKLSKVLDLANNAKVTATGGLFYNTQKVSLTWNFNQYVMQATDSNPALIQTPATDANGLAAQGSNVWGGCCTRAIDAEYRTTSPYLALGWDQGALNVDGSVRHDSQKATGNYSQAILVAGNSQFTPATTKAIDYTKDHTSYSIGANYKIDSNLAAFARVSNGVAFNADRIMFANSVLVNPTPITNIPLTSSAVVAINEVDQYEGGVKLRSGNLSAFVTLFQAKTKESNYDATSQISSANSYDAKGVELETGYKLGKVNISGGATWTNSKVTASNTAAMVGKTPNRLAKLIYQLTPTYTQGDVTVGANFVGTTSSKDAQLSGNEATLQGYTLVNAFGNYKLTKETNLTLGVSNLFNKLAYTESNPDRMAARAVNGRMVKVGVKYDF